MNDAEFRELLADYIGGELDEQRAAAFRAELEADPQRRRLAEELQAAAAALEANVVSPEEAKERTEALELARISRDSANASRRALRADRVRSIRFRAVLRYAAVIVLAFGGGFLARGWMPGTRSSVGAADQTRPVAGDQMSVPPLEVTTAINEQLVVNFRQATKSFPESSTFSRALLALARK
jgi:anti-sigma factor RsiW